METAAPHDWLTLTGGAIGQGLPLALGAALACPEQKVIALQADGSAMYTIQALWSIARENVDVTVVLLNNRWVYAMAACGEAGLVDLLKLFQQEIATAMALMGVTRIDEHPRIDRNYMSEFVNGRE